MVERIQVGLCTLVPALSQVVGAVARVQVARLKKMPVETLRGPQPVEDPKELLMESSLLDVTIG